MALGTVVVAADLHSGALITANFATEKGGQIFLVPGRIDLTRIRGLLDLITQGSPTWPGRSSRSIACGGLGR
jgi:DNA processing protein